MNSPKDLKVRVKLWQITKDYKYLGYMTETHVFHCFPRLKPATYVNIKRYSTSWTPPRNHPFISQRNLAVSSPEWLQSVSQRSLENLSPLKVPKKKKKHSRIKAAKTNDMKHLSSKWEAAPSSSEKDADVTKEKSLQAEESNEQNSMQIAPHPTKKRDAQPRKNHGQPTFYLKFQRGK